MEKVRVGLVGTYQDSFDAVKAREIFNDSVKELKELGRQQGFTVVPIMELLLDGEDAEKARVELDSQKVDIVLCQVSCFASGEIITPLALTNARLGLWAVPESTEDGPLPLNSFCGMNMYSSIIAYHLKNHDIPYKWFFGSVRDQLFRDRFDITVRVLNTIKNLRNSNIALIGGVAPGFKDLDYDARLLESRYGVNTFSLELVEVLDRVDKFSVGQTKAAIDELKGSASCIDVDNGEYERNARLYLAFRQLAEERNLKAMAISCWPELQTRYQVKPCSVLGQLNENNIVAACEGDLPSALSMLMLNLLNDERSILMDLSSFDSTDETVMMWHCGPAAPCWAENIIQHRKISIGREDLVDYGIGNDLVLKAGPVTAMRLTGEGDEVFTFTGEFLKNQKKSFHGSRGWMGNIRMNEEALTALDLINTVMVHGFQHHFPIAIGEVNELVMELCSWLDLKVLPPIRYRNYFQRAK